MKSPTDAAKRLTDLNAGTAALQLGQTEIIDWQNERLRGERDSHLST